MQTEKLAKICDFYGAGRFLRVASIQKVGFIHKVLQLQTTKNFYLLKRYSFGEKNQLLVMKEILKFFFDHHIPLAQPIYYSTNLFFDESRYCWLLFPWINGKCLELDEITESHVRIIAEITAKIHSFSLNVPQASPVLSSTIDTEIISELVGSKEIFKWHEQFCAAKNILKQNLIISHGDLLSSNVIWQTNNNPVLIDWDHCGWINQDIDLFNTAINWSGIETGRVNMDIYRVFMGIYHLTNPRPIEINPEQIHASLGSWLRWLEFIVKKLPRKRAEQQLAVTMRALRYLSENVASLSVRFA